MAKRERGLPAGLTISVPSEMLEASVPQPLRDFLDEAIATKEAADRAGTLPLIDGNAAIAPEREAPKGTATRHVPRSVPKRRSWPQPPSRGFNPSTDDDRLQLRMTPEARKTLASLVEHFTRYGPNKRAPASDIIGALILALGDARAEIDLAGVPRRGGYGSPSAEAHRVHLKQAVAHAIAKHQASGREV